MTGSLGATQPQRGSAEHGRILHTLSFAHCQEIDTLFFVTANKLTNLTICKIKHAVIAVLLDCVMEIDIFCLRSCLYCQVSTVLSRPNLAGA